MQSTDYNAMELMICCASRLLEDAAVVAVGTGVPCASAPPPDPHRPPFSKPVEDDQRLEFFGVEPEAG